MEPGWNAARPKGNWATFGLIVKVISFQNVEISQTGTFRYQLRAYASKDCVLKDTLPVVAGDVVRYQRTNENADRNLDTSRCATWTPRTYLTQAFNVQYCDQTVWMDELVSLAVSADDSDEYLTLEVQLLRLGADGQFISVGASGMFIHIGTLFTHIRNHQDPEGMAKAVCSSTLTMEGGYYHRCTLMAVPSLLGYYRPTEISFPTPESPKRSLTTPTALFSACARVTASPDQPPRSMVQPSFTPDTVTQETRWTPVMPMYCAPDCSTDMAFGEFHTDALVAFFQRTGEPVVLSDIDILRAQQKGAIGLCRSLLDKSKVLFETISGVSRLRCRDLGREGEKGYKSFVRESSHDMMVFTRQSADELDETIDCKEHRDVSEIVRMDRSPGKPPINPNGAPHLWHDDALLPTLGKTPFVTHRSYWLKTPPAGITADDQNDLFVFVHGLKGSWADLVFIRAEIRRHYPSAACIMAHTHTGHTGSDINVQGDRVTQELLAQWDNRPRVHFITHSMGALVTLRIIERLRELSSVDADGPATEVLARTHSLIAIAAPLLGFACSSSMLMKGAVLLSKLSVLPSTAIKQLSFTDATDIEAMFLHQKAQSGAIAAFRHVALISATGDDYVPSSSALLLRVPTSAMAYEKVRQAHLGQLVSHGVRLDKLVMSFPTLRDFGAIDRTIGRAAHIKLLDDQVAASIMARRILELIAASVALDE